MENNQEWFKPSEIARQKLITRKFGSNEYHSLYRTIIALIKSGTLPARIWTEQGTGTPHHRAQYMVHINDINSYREAQNGTN